MSYQAEVQDVITLDRLQMGVTLSIGNALASSLEVDKNYDAYLRHTIYAISAWFTSHRIFEKEQIIQRQLSWRERISALFGRPLPIAIKVEMRRNCPHLEADNQDDHLTFIIPKREEPS